MCIWCCSKTQNLSPGACWGRIYHLSVYHRIQVTSLPYPPPIPSLPLTSWMTWIKSLKWRAWTSQWFSHVSMAVWGPPTEFLIQKVWVGAWESVFLVSRGRWYYCWSALHSENYWILNVLSSSNVFYFIYLYFTYLYFMLLGFYSLRLYGGLDWISFPGRHCNVVLKNWQLEFMSRPVESCLLTKVCACDLGKITYPLTTSFSSGKWG